MEETENLCLHNIPLQRHLQIVVRNTKNNFFHFKRNSTTIDDRRSEWTFQFWVYATSKQTKHWRFDATSTNFFNCFMVYGDNKIIYFGTHIPCELVWASQLVGIRWNFCKNVFCLKWTSQKNCCYILTQNNTTVFFHLNNNNKQHFFYYNKLDCDCTIDKTKICVIDML